MKKYFASGPTDRPLTYPGAIPDFSYILLPGRRLMELHVVPQRRLGQSRAVRTENEDAPGLSYTSLNYVLLSHNAAPMDARIPVLAIGSNAAPAQLSEKLAHPQISSVVPVLQGNVKALKVAPSAHVNHRGYVPAAPSVAPTGLDPGLPAFVTFFDEEQLKWMDETEPNYERVLLDCTYHRLRLSNGEPLRECSVYQSIHGIIDDPRVMDDYGFMPSQTMLIGNLLQVLPGIASENVKDPRSFVDAIRKKTLSADAVTEAVRRTLRVSEAGLRVSGGKPRRYVELWGAEDETSGEALRVVASSTPVPGEDCCVLPRDFNSRLPKSSHVSVEFERSKLSVVARRVKGDVPEGRVALDQSIRNALGVELNEQVAVAPVTIQRSRASRISDRILGESRYVLARTQAADLSTLEQAACVLPDIALDLLGIDTGDVVVAEGTADPMGRVRTLRLRAFRAPEEMLSQRRQIAGGDRSARFPSARDALAVHPDLPWAFLDQRCRSELGLEKLGPVRLRASKLQQLTKEVRELSLVIALALVGIVIAGVPDIVKALGGLALAMVLATVVVIRLRARLARPQNLSLIVAGRTGERSLAAKDA